MKTRTVVLISVLLLAATSCAPSVPQAQFEEAQATIQQLNGEVASLQSLADGHQATAVAAEARIAESQSQLEEVRAERVEALRTVSELTRTVAQYECEETLSDMQYDSIVDASTMLEAFVAQQDWSERVNGSYRDSIWSNADSKIHGVRYVDASDHQPYVAYFMVYFDEFEFDRGVFWIDRQCWLERR